MPPSSLNRETKLRDERLKMLCESITISALLYGLGNALAENSWIKFSDFLVEKIDEYMNLE